jgi:hypothetical protein
MSDYPKLPEGSPDPQTIAAGLTVRELLRSEINDYPLMDVGGQYCRIYGFPAKLIEPFDERAQINHSQTLKRLAERGGLSPQELVAIILDKCWTDTNLMPTWDAVYFLLQFRRRKLNV